MTAPTTRALVVASLAAAGLGGLPLAAAFLAGLWQKPEYQFFPQALAGAFFLAWTRRPGPGECRPGGGPWIHALLAGAFVLLLVATAVWSPWLGYVGLWIGLLGIWGALGGARLLRAMAPAMVMAAVIIPPPLGIAELISQQLRNWATILSSRVLDFIGVVHATSGQLIELPGRRLFVEEACSGVNSLVFAFAFGVFFLLWKHHPLRTYAVLLPLMAVFVLVGNVVRIAGGAWLLAVWNIDVLTGRPHELVGVFLVAIYILLVVSLESFFPRPVGPRVPPTFWDKVAQGNPWPPRSWLLLGSAGVFFAVAGTWQTVRKAGEGIEVLAPAAHSAEWLADSGLPDRIADWTRVEAGPPGRRTIETLGLSSLFWTYEMGDLRAIVAWDFPIRGYHDVEGCYINSGWSIETRELLKGDPAPVRLALRREPSQHAGLWFLTLNERGETVDEANPLHRFLGRLAGLGFGSQTTFRVQVLVISPEPLSLAQKTAAGELLAETGRLLKARVQEAVRK